MGGGGDVGKKEGEGTQATVRESGERGTRSKSQANLQKGGGGPNTV